MTPSHRILWTAIITMICVVVIQAIIGLIVVYSGLYNVAADRPHAGIVRWLLSTTMERSVEQHAKGLNAPEQVSVAEGAVHFSRNCVMCHGGPGVEKSEAGKGLNPDAPDLARTAPEWTLNDVYWIADHGVKMTGMPGFSHTHTEQQLWALAYFVKQLPQLTPAEYQGMIAKGSE